MWALTLGRTSFLVCSLAVLVYLLLLPGGPAWAAGTFTASADVSLSSTATNADADSTVVLNIPSPDYNFSSVVNATPGGAFLAPSPGHTSFSGASHPALGDVVGNLTSNTFLGLTNNPCNGNLTVTFTFLNATVDVTDTIDPVPQAATNSADGGTLANQWTDNGASPMADAPWNAAWSGLTAAEQVNGLPAQVDDYPTYLNTLFTPDGGSPVQPIARYAGGTNVAGTVVVLNVVVFAPDVLANAFPAPHPFNDMKGLGYTAIAVLQNPTAEAAPSSITDFCTPLTVSTLFFGESKVNACNGSTLPPCNTAPGINVPTPAGNSGKDRYRNPSVAGTHLWVSFHQSLRDSDGDGKENAFDPCPITSDTYNQRVGTGADGDTDGIPDACDTNPNGDTDSDTDGWDNRGDNCPQTANATNIETEITTPYLTSAKRGGPRTDGMGDACDANPNASDGAFETTLSVNAICIGGTDGDGDGWCATNAANTNLNDPNEGNSSRSPEDYDLVFPMGVTHSGSGAAPPMRQPLQVCNDGIDNDGDTLVDRADFDTASTPGSSTCRPKNMTVHPGAGPCGTLGCAADTDGDGFTNEEEILIGTDALGRCNIGSATNPSSDWPLDFVSAGASLDAIKLDDLTSFLAPARFLDKSPPNALYNPRYDLIPGPSVSTSPWVQLNDLTALIAGVTGQPPMTGGAKAFNGASCTAHPTYGD